MMRQEGRERYCDIQLKSLREVAMWTEQYRQFWESKFDSLEKYLDKLQKNKKHAKKRK